MQNAQNSYSSHTKHGTLILQGLKYNKQENVILTRNEIKRQRPQNITGKKFLYEHQKFPSKTECSTLKNISACQST